MREDQKEVESHLSDAELFALAAPATGEPEAIPEHLSRCRDCARALREWKIAVRALGDEDTGALARRSAAEWRAAEDATLERIRSAGRSRRAHPWRWALAAAASLLVAALVLSGRRAAPTPVAAVRATPAPAATAASGELSPADAADDALLRESAYLASGADVDADALEGRL
ncbi:MAG: hypothetical protein ACM3NW_00220 [Syntrophomonadaceae bacterium]